MLISGFSIFLVLTEERVMIMKILHTGDLHLDSPFAGLDISRAERRRREMREVFSRMMRFAKESAVDMVVIAGDLFDSAFVTRETVMLLCREFSALSCPVVISPGNHDPYTAGSVWEKTAFPENVHIFKDSSLQRFSFDSLGCDVYGYAFTSAYETECRLGGRVIDPDRINILLCHGDVTSPISKYAPLPPAAIRAFGADYAALGHIHNTQATEAPLKGLGAYCGCPEGRDFGECGEKGALMIDIGKDVTAVDFVRFSKRVYESHNLNVDGAEDMSSVSAAIDSFVKGCGFGEEHLLRINLIGSVSPSLVISTEALSENTRGLFYLEIEDSTSPTWNAALLAGDRGIRGELYRTLLPDLEGEDSEKRKTAALALRYGLAALSGEDISDI